jgi:hypothetical protein
MEESMGLARVYLVRIIAALLPRNVREHVLGDLAERGYHFHDIANVLPLVWWSSFRRITAIPSVEGSTDAAFERRFNQFSRENGIAFALIYLSWSVIVTIVYRELWYLIFVFIVLAGIVVWPYFLSSVRRHITIAPRRDGTWRERYTFRLRGQRASFGMYILILFVDTLGRWAAVHNGRTWPLTGPRVELPLPYLTLNLSISTLVLCALNFLWVYRVHREIRKLESN